MSNFVRVTRVSSCKQIIINSKEIKAFYPSIDGTMVELYDDSEIVVKESIDQIEARLLRDEFAMRAMTAMIASGATYQKWEHLSIDAYALAGAMLKERNK